jgi:hypothetical protein
MSIIISIACLSRKTEALHQFDFFRVSLHAGAADSSLFQHVMVRRFLIMLPVISALLACVTGLFRSRASLYLEHLALRHQLAVYQHTIHRPRIRPTDRLFWAWLSRLWTGWQSALAFVQPHTVIAWQRQRSRDHWRRLSQRSALGRPTIAKDVRDLIRTMWQTNPTWGAPRIVGELRKLGIDVAKSTVEKYRPYTCTVRIISDEPVRSRPRCVNQPVMSTPIRVPGPDYALLACRRAHLARAAFR